MRYVPAEAGDQAGITAFHNENHHFLLSVARTAEGTSCDSRQRADTAPARVLAEAPDAGPRGRTPIFLRIIRARPPVHVLVRHVA